MREGSPYCWEGDDGKFLNFAYPEMHSGLVGGHCKLNYKQEFSSKYHSDKCSNDSFRFMLNVIETTQRQRWTVVNEHEEDVYNY